MRITGGNLAGRQALVPPGVIRPAMDRMRESVFAVLGDISGNSFLDLFSGSGIIALEAASRGASYIEAVEQDKQKSAVLIKNTRLALPVRINCRFISCELYIKRGKHPFDIIFCDPPFPYKYKQDLLAGIAASPLLAGGGLLLVHRPREEEFACPPELVLDKRREYGRSVVDFWRKNI
ncbi:MAG: RsmD family RNA methyltransferase [Spirochaetaceae bacterium]|jgi:16S rRNA (guanine(966)-N(2))-methyltransferase RsmD|nr:RsmD family RNA methyltransferase [Spirochaetaceae bacterium]